MIKQKTLVVSGVGALLVLCAIMAAFRSGDKNAATGLSAKTHAVQGAELIAATKRSDKIGSKKSSKVREVATSANYAHYNTVDELDKAADVILIGSPTKDFDSQEHMETRFADGTLQDFYTLTSLQVKSVIKKPASLDLSANQVFQVIEPIGLINEGKNGKVKVSTEDYREMKQGKEYILFLQSNGRGKYGVINMNSGKFNIDGTDTDDLGEKAAKDKKSKLKHDVLKKYVQP